MLQMLCLIRYLTCSIEQAYSIQQGMVCSLAIICVDLSKMLPLSLVYLFVRLQNEIIWEKKKKEKDLLESWQSVYIEGTYMEQWIFLTLMLLVLPLFQ